MDYLKKIRQYPLTEQECFFMPEAMFNIPALHEAFELFNHHLPNASAETFFSYLLHLEKDVPINNQKCNINFFHKK